MLAKEVVAEFGGRARFVVEDLGASPIAERFGVETYPAIFVDAALIARPEDFYEWGGPAAGKYLPWSEIENRRKFQADLRRMVQMRLDGGELASLEITPGATIRRTLPDVAMADLDGGTVTFRELRGKPVLVEFWATWCPMCLVSMEWMKSLDPASVAVVNVAIDSKRADIESVAATLDPIGRIVLGDERIREAFGGPPAVPTLVLADREGTIVRTFYGAPDSLHEDVALALEEIDEVDRGAGRSVADQRSGDAGDRNRTTTEDEKLDM